MYIQLQMEPTNRLSQNYRTVLRIQFNLEKIHNYFWRNKTKYSSHKVTFITKLVEIIK